MDIKTVKGTLRVNSFDAEVIVDCEDCGGAWPAGQSGYMMELDTGTMEDLGEVTALCVDCSKNYKVIPHDEH